MINLLPNQIKDGYVYARRNVILIRWLFAFLFALAGLAAIGITGYIYMHHLSGNYQTQISAKQDSLTQQKLNQTQASAKDISGSIKLAVKVLGKEVLFSDLLKQLAKVTPSNARLSTLNISQTAGALDITAVAASIPAATQLQVNLADPGNKIFASADIVNISCSSGTTSSSSAYPCQVTIRALFANDNPFLFINAGDKK